VRPEGVRIEIKSIRIHRTTDTRIFRRQLIDSAHIYQPVTGASVALIARLCITMYS
jgi:hypothetical protein